MQWDNYMLPQFTVTNNCAPDGSHVGKAQANVELLEHLGKLTNTLIPYNKKSYHRVGGELHIYRSKSNLLLKDAVAEKLQRIKATVLVICINNHHYPHLVTKEVPGLPGRNGYRSSIGLAM